METNSRKLIRMLEKDGWVLDRIKGDHHTFKHEHIPDLISIAHPKKDLAIGQVRAIYRIAGWKP